VRKNCTTISGKVFVNKQRNLEGVIEERTENIPKERDSGNSSSSTSDRVNVG
jgi:hypothetical protein